MTLMASCVAILITTGPLLLPVMAVTLIGHHSECRVLRGLRAQLPGQRRRRQRGPARVDQQARLPQRRRPGHRPRPGGDSAVADAGHAVPPATTATTRSTTTRSRRTTGPTTTSASSWGWPTRGGCA
jgi:hypothetical protein